MQMECEDVLMMAEGLFTLQVSVENASVSFCFFFTLHQVYRVMLIYMNNDKGYDGVIINTFLTAINLWAIDVPTFTQ